MGVYSENIAFQRKIIEPKLTELNQTELNLIEPHRTKSNPN